MAIINRYAALRPLLIIASGIAASYYLKLPNIFWVLTSTLISISALVLHFRAQKIKWVQLSGALLLIALGCFAALRYGLYNSIPKNIFEAKNESIYNGYISKIIKETPDFTRVELQLDSPQTTIITYISNIQLKPEPGDQILFKGSINSISKPLNPGQFDTKTYYGYKKIYGQIFLQKGTYVLSKTNKYPIRKFFYKVSYFIRQKIISFIPDKTSSALIQGVLLGIRHDLDPELMKLFAHAGIMHILSVSGMHAAILYGGLFFLIKNRAKKKPKLRLIPVIGVWLFALLTGAGPAVLRAALIVTLTDSGNIFKKQVNSLNLLMSSAIILLLLQPYLIWDIGFQLSYAAMLGIILTYKAFKGIVYFQNKYVRQYLWEPTALSVSAQMFTTAPALYYFGIFPASFIITNIVTMIPVTLMLFGSILMVIIGSFIPTIGLFIGKLLTYLIHYLFILPLEWIHKIPYSYFEFIPFNWLQLLLLTFTLSLLTYWILNPRKSKILLSSILCFYIFLVYGFIDKHFISTTSPEIIVYHVPKKTVIGLPNKKEISFWGDSNIVKNPESFDFFLSGSYRLFKTKPIQKNNILSNTAQCVSDSLLILTPNFKIFILTPSTKISGQTTHKIKVDYILLKNHPYIKTDQLLKNFEFKAIILDGNISNGKRKIYRRIFDKANIPYYDTQENGALII